LSRKTQLTKEVEMKKLIAGLLLAAMTLGVAAPTMAADKGRGGVMGFFAGCCFGVRAAGDYNEGKEIGWREWIRVVPYVGLVFGIWDGIEGAQGVTRAEYAEKYGSTFY
jgi:hypothetical protein